MKKEIGIGALSAIIAGLLVLGGVNYLEDTDIYYCEARELVMKCDKLSLTGKTCYNIDVGNKRCLTVWTKVIPDIIEPNKTIEKIPQPVGKQYLCGQKECVVI